MLFNLGLPAAAAASHRHEFSKHHSEMSPDASDSQHSYLQPLHYLQETLLALTGAGTPVQHDDKNSTRPATASSGHSSAEGRTLDTESIASGSRRPSASRKKTVYQLAHPVAKSRVVHLKSPMLLQIRQVDASRRAAPVLEVFKRQSSSRSATRNLSRKSSTRQLTSKGDGQKEKLVFVSCDSYDGVEGDEGPSEDEDLDKRVEIASISHGTVTESDSRAILQIGEEHWEVHSMKNGGYEFSCLDAEGNERSKARWVPKPAAERRPILRTPSTINRAGPEKQFRFALLNPAGRRHPIVGSMDCHAIEVRDQFVIPDTPIATPDISSPSASGPEMWSASNSYFNDVQPSSNGVVTTSEHTRLLMLVTGVWVAIMEGWTHYRQLSNESTDYPTSQASASPSKMRNASPRPDVRHGTRSDLPRSFTNNLSHVFTGRRHRHTISAGPIPTIEDGLILETPPVRRHSGMSLQPPSTLYGSNGTTPAASSENVVAAHSREPSPSRSGPGLNTSAHSTFSASILEEPRSPSPSGFHEFLGRLSLGKRPAGRPMSDTAADAQSLSLARQSSTASCKSGQRKPASKDKANRTRRLLGFRRKGRDAG